MPNKHRKRRAKIVTGGHSSLEKVGGLRQLLARIEGWPEVLTIRLGEVRRRRGGPGGVHLRPTRWAVWSSGEVYGVQCVASSGAFIQDIVITSRDPQALGHRLNAEGYQFQLKEES